MRNLLLIITIGLFTFNTNAQSFEYGDLVDLKQMSASNRATVLTNKGFTYEGEGVITTLGVAKDTIAKVWVKADEEVRYNAESVEYQWYGDSARIKKKTAHKTVKTNISWEMFESCKKYCRLKRKQGTYNANELDSGKLTKSDYTYFVGEGFYTNMNYEDQVLFIGEIDGIVN